jgi:NAD(P)-dependent dehydrogenase (short-subunit alcohol dehydrogenase family)
MTLEGSVAVVAGRTLGVGKAIADALGGRGANADPSWGEPGQEPRWRR